MLSLMTGARLNRCAVFIERGRTMKQVECCNTDDAFLTPDIFHIKPVKRTCWSACLGVISSIWGGIHNCFKLCWASLEAVFCMPVANFNSDVLLCSVLLIFPCSLWEARGCHASSKGCVRFSKPIDFDAVLLCCQRKLSSLKVPGLFLCVRNKLNVGSIFAGHTRAS